MAPDVPFDGDLARVLANTNGAIPTTEPLRWEIQSAQEIHASGVAGVEFDIEDLLTKDDGPGYIFGAPASLKTWIALHAAHCMVTGQKFLGRFKIRKRPYAIYVNMDAGASAFARRVLKVVPGDVQNLYVTSPESFEKGQLEALLSTFPGAFIVLDCFMDMYRSTSRDDQAETMRAFCRDLRALFAKYDCNGLLVDHPRRSKTDDGAPGDYYGSVQKEAALRGMTQISRLRDEGTTTYLKIACKKMSEAERFAPFECSVTFAEECVTFGYVGPIGGDGAAAQPTAEQRLAVDAERVADLCRGVPGGLPQASIASRLGFARDRTYAALKAAADFGVEPVGSGRGTIYRHRDHAEGFPNLPKAQEDSQDDSASSAVSPENNLPTHPDPLGFQDVGRSFQGDSSGVSGPENLPSASDDSQGEPADVHPRGESDAAKW